MEATSHPGGQPEPAQPAVSVWNIANALTIARIAMVPAFAILLLQDGGTRPSLRWAAAVVFGLAALTDKLDGNLARSRGIITDFGKIADPIADKALIGTALVVLSWLGELSWWVTGLILAREVGITLMRFVVIRIAVIPASRGGKLKTVAQIVAILLYVLPTQSITWIWVVAQVMMFLALAITVLTGLDYVIKTIALVRTARGDRATPGPDGAARGAHIARGPDGVRPDAP